MKKIVFGTIGTIFTVFALALVVAPALAASDTGYGSQPGHNQVLEVGAQCGTGAGSGAFGVYSHGYIPTWYPDPHTRAANGVQTGLNNSAVCGNRQ